MDQSFHEEWLVKQLRSKPRSTEWILKNLGNEGLNLVRALAAQVEVWWGVAFGGKCWYWVPPKRQSKAQERVLSEHEIDVRGPLK